MVLVVSTDAVYDNEGNKVLDRCKRCQTFVKVGVEYCVKCAVLIKCAWCDTKIEGHIFVCPFSGRGYHREHWKIAKAKEKL